MDGNQYLIEGMPEDMDAWMESYAAKLGESGFDNDGDVTLSGSSSDRYRVRVMVGLG